MTAEQLMKLAEDKYKIFFNRGARKAAPDADKRILALEAKIKGMQKKGKPNKDSNGEKGKGQKNPKDPPKQAKEKRNSRMDDQDSKTR